MFIENELDQAFVDLFEWFWVIVCLCELFIERMAYLGRKEKASIPNVFRGSCVKILGESHGMLHMNFLKLMRSLFSFVMIGPERGPM